MTTISLNGDGSSTSRALLEAEVFGANHLQQRQLFHVLPPTPRGVIQIFNVGAERMLGYTAKDVVNKITPADISDPREIVARAHALSAELHTSIAPGFEALVFKASPASRTSTS